MADSIPTLMKQGHEDPVVAIVLCPIYIIYIYPYISVYLNQIDAHRRSYMDLTAQVPLLTVKLANHYESLAVHSHRSQVGFLMNLAYFMAAAGDRKKTEMGVATCRDHTPLWYCTMWAQVEFLLVYSSVCSWTPAVRCHNVLLSL